MGRYLIGIDLGTTNSAVAFVDLQAKAKSGVKLQTFPIAQLVATGEMGEQPLLPSFLSRCLSGTDVGPRSAPTGALCSSDCAAPSRMSRQ